MATIMNVSNVVYRHYHHIFHDLVDHRSDQLLLMASPWPSVAILAVYFYFVKILGPRMMENRKPFKLDMIINIYNLSQIAVCVYLCERAYTLAWGGKYKILCEPLDYSNDYESVQGVKAIWLYYIIKIVDLFDTVFFVLRKKQNQVTFLHVYHHMGMVIVTWIWVRFLPGGHGSITGSLNSFVHIWMYLYYFITSMWPEYRKNIWWKKYLTQLQMVQFIIVFLHSLSSFFVPDCKYPAIPRGFILIQSVVFFMLFFNFYVNAYHKKKKDA